MAAIVGEVLRLWEMSVQAEGGHMKFPLPRYFSTKLCFSKVFFPALCLIGKFFKIRNLKTKVKMKKRNNRLKVVLKYFDGVIDEAGMKREKFWH